MKVSVRLFARGRELAGAEEVEIDLPDGATVARLRQSLAEQVPPLARLSRHVMFAVDARYVDDAATLSPGAEVACIPPVSGG